MAMSVSQPGRRSTQLWKRVRQVLLILTVVLIVIAILFVIVYGVGIHHQHSSTNHRPVPATVTR
jgi:TRAP-type C4-dicarboxylate transport system permease small subunit